MKICDGDYVNATIGGAWGLGEGILTVGMPASGKLFNVGRNASKASSFDYGYDFGSQRMSSQTGHAWEYSEASFVLRETGARRFLDPGSEDHGWALVEGRYDEIRRNVEDVDRIAANTGWPKFRIARIKEHVFFNKHYLDEGYARFGADPTIYNAWNRLEQGDFTRTDIDLLRHEIFEAKLEGIFKTNYRTAHDLTDKHGRKWEPEDY